MTDMRDYATDMRDYSYEKKFALKFAGVYYNTISEAISLVFFFSIFIFKLQHSGINGSLRAQQSNLCWAFTQVSRSWDWNISEKEEFHFLN